MTPKGNVEKQSLSTEPYCRSTLVRFADYVGGWIFKKLFEIGNAVTFACSTLSLMFKRPFQFNLHVHINSVVVSLIKSSTFGMAIASVGCYKGFAISSAGGAEGVGKATTGSAVTSLISILILDFVLNHVLDTIW